MKTITATYTNKATGETYKLAGLRNAAAAWNMAAFVCQRMNWNASMFTYDVVVKIA